MSDRRRPYQPAAGGRRPFEPAAITAYAGAEPPGRRPRQDCRGAAPAVAPTAADGYSPGFALVAYAGTGKDTLVRELREGRLLFHEVWSGENGRWIVCGPAVPNARADAALARLLDPANAGCVTRYAFADALKAETHAWLGLRDCPAHAFEAVKDTARFVHPVSGELRTPRECYIEHGQRRRREDPLCWARLIAERIVADKRLVFRVGTKMPLDVTTDFRFDNELTPRPHGGDTVVTLRLYRAAVKVADPLPDRASDSEHNLDGLRTDFLLAPAGDVAASIALFPQYADYVVRGSIVARED